MRRPVPATEREKETSAEVEAAGSPDDPWGLGSIDGTEQVSLPPQKQEAGWWHVWCYKLRLLRTSLPARLCAYKPEALLA